MRFKLVWGLYCPLPETSQDLEETSIDLKNTRVFTIYRSTEYNIYWLRRDASRTFRAAKKRPDIEFKAMHVDSAVAAQTEWPHA